jgi:hypothetical protein
MVVGMANRVVWVGLALAGVGCTPEVPDNPPTDTGGTGPASGGTTASGGNPGTGGSATGGINPSTGGTSGGTPTSTGGKASGGTATGGAATGGKATGGTATGGTPVGGQATGGAATGGKATGGTATGGAGTGGGTATGGTGGGCSVVPVTPNATQQTKNVLCYLYSIYGKQVLSGQQLANWNNNPTDITWYSSNGLKLPAIHGSDFAYHASAGCSGVNISTTNAIAYWNAGGLVMYRYHAGQPAAGLTCAEDCYSGTNCSMSTPPSGFFTNVITAGTAQNTSWIAKLDNVAIQISAMKAANMPVILALFHETQSNGWFWWSKTTSGSEFVNLYKYSFDYLTKTKGLNNIIWLMPFSGSPSAAFYPGKAYVDIGGGDTYGSNQPFTSLYSSCRNILGTTMPLTLHECGTPPQPSAMFPTVAPWVLFSVWTGYQQAQLANLRTIYADSHTITRDMVPNLR